MSIRETASYLGTIAQLAARGFRARGAERKLPKERLVVERRGIRISPRRLERYLRATEGAGIARFHGPDAILPPIYPAVWETPLVMELLLLPPVPPAPGGVIHLESESLTLRPLRPRDTVRCRLELERARPDSRGLCLHLVTRHWNGAGQLCAENCAVMLLRGAVVAGGRVPTPGSRPDRQTDAEGEHPQEAWEEIARWSLRGSHGRRYARASGDYNPIHLWRLTARPLGFRRPILHGFCTEALVAHALIARRWEGDPTRLRRLQIRFRAPLLLPARVALQTADTPEGARFRVVGAEGRSKGRVYAHGSFTGG